MFLLLMVLHIKEMLIKEYCRNWWNHKILTSNSQIVLFLEVKQEVNFIAKESIEINGNIIAVDHFKLKSTDEA